MYYSVEDKFKKVVHAVAVNEHRSGFHGRSIFNSQKEANAGDKKNRIERGFLGAHSDIGGGYPEGDLSDIALMWVVKEAGLAGVDLNIPDKYNYVQTPTVHDNVGSIKLYQYHPNREFLWANQGEKRGNQEQFNSFSHLKLNWIDTLEFENEDYIKKNGSKFESIRKLLDDFDKKEYMALKKNETILYDGNVADEKIIIKDYVNWVNTNYGTTLVTK